MWINWNPSNFLGYQVLSTSLSKWHSFSYWTWSFETGWNFINNVLSNLLVTAYSCLAVLQNYSKDLVSVVVRVVSCVSWVIAWYEYVTCCFQLLDRVFSAVANQVLGKAAQLTGVFDQRVVLVLVNVVDQGLLLVGSVDNLDSSLLVTIEGWNNFLWSYFILVWSQTRDSWASYTLQTLRINRSPSDFLSYQVLSTSLSKWHSFSYWTWSFETGWNFINNVLSNLLVTAYSCLAVLQNYSKDLVSVVVRVVSCVSWVIAWYEYVTCCFQLLDRVFSAVSDSFLGKTAQLTGVFDQRVVLVLVDVSYQSLLLIGSVDNLDSGFLVTIEGWNDFLWSYFILVWSQARDSWASYALQALWINRNPSYFLGYHILVTSLSEGQSLFNWFWRVKPCWHFVNYSPLYILVTVNALVSMLQNYSVDLVSVVISVISCVSWVVAWYEYVASINELLDRVGSTVANQVLGQTAHVAGVFDQLVVLIFIDVSYQSILDIWRVDDLYSSFLVTVEGWSYYFRCNFVLVSSQTCNLWTSYSLQALWVNRLPSDFLGYHILVTSLSEGQSLFYGFWRIETFWHFVNYSPSYILVTVNRLVAVLQNYSIDLISVVISVVNCVTWVVAWYEYVACINELLDCLGSAVANQVLRQTAHVAGVFD